MGIEQALFIAVTVVLIVLLVCIIIVLIFAAVFIKRLQRLADKLEAGADNFSGLIKSWVMKLAPATLGQVMAAAVTKWRKERRANK